MLNSADNIETPLGHLQINVCSFEGPEMNYRLVRALRDELGPHAQLLVLCTMEAEDPFPDFGPHVTFEAFPGKSAIDMPALISSAAAGCVREK